jgi:hypothetical protein
VRLPAEAQEARAAIASFGTQLGAAFDFARLFVVLAPTHFFFEAASFDQLAKAAYRFLNRLSVPNRQLYQHSLLFMKRSNFEEPISLVINIG